jgi:membrane protease YdiL (CAAX protease family)
MDAVIELLQSLLNVVSSLLAVVMALVRVILPWLPLLAWIAYWSLCVNWAKAHGIIWRRGGIIGVLLLMFVTVIVWGSVAPPQDGVHTLFGLNVSNYVGKFVYTTMLTCIVFLCGSVQMSGTFGSLVDFSNEDQVADDHGHAPQTH